LWPKKQPSSGSGWPAATWLAAEAPTSAGICLAAEAAKLKCFCNSSSSSKTIGEVNSLAKDLPKTGEWDWSSHQDKSDGVAPENGVAGLEPPAEVGVGAASIPLEPTAHAACPSCEATICKAVLQE
jgi:hypothetical protein